MANSHAWWDTLNDQQKKERVENNKRAKCMLERKLSYFESLKKELKKDVAFIIDDTIATKDHTHFIDRARKMFTHLLSNKKTTRANLSTIISSFMDTRIEKNKNRNKDVVIEEEEKK